MKFRGPDPNVHIIDYEFDKEKFVLDENGEYETDDPKMIDWIKKNKNFLKPVEDEKKEAIEEKKMHKCKKCDFETENSGLLMAHYRKEHPKE
jgi:hypothetical protein